VNRFRVTQSHVIQSHVIQSRVHVLRAHLLRANLPKPCRQWCHRIEAVIVANRTVRHIVVTACAIGAAWCWLSATSA